MIFYTKKGEDMIANKLLLATLLLSTSINTFAEQGKKLKLFKKQTLCRDLKIGGSHRVNIGRAFSRSGVEFKYTLKRSSNDIYDVYINYNLKPNTAMRIFGMSKADAASKYKPKIQKCFDKNQHKLKDGYGRQIRLHVYDENKHTNITKPPKVGIKIVTPMKRSHSRAYAASVGCSTIIHEAFHLLGLPDEYEEKWMSWNPHFLGRAFKPFVKAEEPKDYAYNCRSHGSNHSVMTNPHEMQYFRNILHEKHVDMIIYPNCKKKNKVFFQCSKNAYRTSKDHGGFLGCRSVPQECQSEAWLGK
jgi:hypothetical protein